ncbi:hypothetical protein HYFRA_00007743 [Hymenoscyphus fraxineus]|uniref:Uncharacterized protein n=1 Tax=Hymenoscyphus fraxineus TaxID=746836 RepID=A0A9N9KMP4_9HELO|nr:hypothetical protein HYFRA_00007743 [Hymenoscyphus fraxineus]
MNRYRGPTIGGPSKATATTTCQKCLKKDRKGVADEQIAKAEQERERKRERQSETPEITSKRRRSASISSASVSSISTTMSRSPSPRRSYAETRQRKPRSPSMSRSPALRKDSSHQDRRYNSISQSPQQPREGKYAPAKRQSEYAKKVPGS